MTENNPSPLVWRCGWPNSDALLRFICPMKWEELRKTDLPDVRYCAECKRNVHLCDSPEQFIDLANRDECVALPAQLHVAGEVATLLENKPQSDLVVGMPRVPGPWDYPEINEVAGRWWGQINQKRQQKTYSLFQQELSDQVGRIAALRMLGQTHASSTLPDGVAMTSEEKERLLQEALTKKKLKEEYRVWEREQRRIKREAEKEALATTEKRRSRLP